MKKAIKSVMIKTFFVLAFFILAVTLQGQPANPIEKRSTAVTPKPDTPGKKQPATTAQKPVADTDSIPALTDSTEFISNRDLRTVDYVIKKIMTSEQYKQAGDPISQYQMLISGINQVFTESKKVWEQKNKIKKQPPK